MWEVGISARRRVTFLSLYLGCSTVSDRLVSVFSVFCKFCVWEGKRFFFKK